MYHQILVIIINEYFDQIHWIRVSELGIHADNEKGIVYTQLGVYMICQSNWKLLGASSNRKRLHSTNKSNVALFGCMLIVLISIE